MVHRLLSEHGVINHVVEPTSILVNRRARRAKTDRLDAQGLLRILTAHAKGDQAAILWRRFNAHQPARPSDIQGSELS